MMIKNQNHFIQNQGWAPNWPSRDTWKELVELEKEIQKVNLYQSKSNLTKEEFRAIKSLIDNKNIIIKPADKGSSVVIMDKMDYLKEGYRQLANEKHYQKVPSPVYPKVSLSINMILKYLNEQRFLDKKQVEYLSVQKSQEKGSFIYCLKFIKINLNMD